MPGLHHLHSWIACSDQSLRVSFQD